MRITSKCVKELCLSNRYLTYHTINWHLLYDKFTAERVTIHKNLITHMCI